jgi:YggT family protein
MVYLLEAFLFLINIVFGLVLAVLMLRFLFQVMGIAFNHPLVQMIYKITSPILRPLHRFIPRWRTVDLATVFLLLAIQMLETTLTLVFNGAMPHFLGLLILSFGDLLSLAIYIFIISIIIQMLMSWVNPDPYHPVASLVNRINDPLLRPARDKIPPLGMIDISALAVLLGLQVSLILIVRPIRDIGISLL